MIIAAGIAALAGVGFTALAWEPSIDAVPPPVPGAFAPDLVRRGSELAAIGNCVTCHTAPAGRPYAGGLGMETPFGTVYATNITPDPETGIGHWSERAFGRSMRRGVDREGRHLYPAFPYDHFTKVTDEDNRALYAFLMTREPVRATAPANELVFPLNVRPLLAGWKLLFLREGPGDAADHGTYLVDGLSHCGSCHTPRNLLGAERRGHDLAGGVADGWAAYAINAASPAPRPWDAESLFFYLRNGWSASHGIARGPMAPVTANLGAAPEGDVRAIAAEIARRMGRRDTAPNPGPDPAAADTRPATADSQSVPPPSGGDPTGRAIYAAACANCHEAGRPLPYGGMHLAGSTAPRAPDPRNIVRVVLDGLPAAEGERAPVMPGFRGVLSDAQMVALLRYLREAFGQAPPWPDVEGTVREVSAAPPQAAYPTDAVRSGPSDPSQRGVSW